VWAQVLLGREASLVFLPLAVLVVATCAAFVVRPGPWAAGLVPRTVLLLGALFGLHYAILIFLAILDDWFSALVAVALTHILSLVVFRIARWVGRRLSQSGISGSAYAGLLLAAWAALSWWFRVEYFESVYDGPLSLLVALLVAPASVVAPFLVLSLVFGPVWCAYALVRISRTLGTFGRPIRTGALAPVSALAAYALSWRIAALKAIETYQSLPESPSDCFLATVAAQGPVAVVGGFVPEGAQGPITPQLQRFKAFEVVLRTLAPWVHRGLRTVYNCVGPWLADRVRSPLMAGALWLALKPLEWCALSWTRLIGGPKAVNATARLYRS